MPRIEAVSFVRADLVPQMADAEEVVAAVERGGAELAGLVLNLRGWERLAATTVDRVDCTLAATETFNRRNGNASLDEAVERVNAVLAVADRPTTVTISCAWGCPFEGEVDPGAVANLCELLDERASSFSRTRSASQRLAACGASSNASRSSGRPSAPTSTTRGTPATRARGLRSTAARRSSTRPSAALGGCPFSPNATGNIATEDLVWQLERDGVATGVDVDALIRIARRLEDVLGHRLDGALHRAAEWP